MSKLRIEYMALSKLQSWPRNPKAHDLPSIQSSIARFGYVNPIIINESTGEILAGHGRLDALIESKQKGEPCPARCRKKGDKWFVPVIRGIELASTEASAYAIADNRIAEVGGWDNEQLCELLEELDKDGGLDGIGYSERDLKNLLAAFREEVGEDQSGQIEEQFMILIECGSEHEQTRILKRLTAEGLTCRALIS